MEQQASLIARIFEIIINLQYFAISDWLKSHGLFFILTIRRWPNLKEVSNILSIWWFIVRVDSFPGKCLIDQWTSFLGAAA